MPNLSVQPLQGQSIGTAQTPLSVAPVAPQGQITSVGQVGQQQPIQPQINYAKIAQDIPKAREIAPNQDMAILENIVQKNPPLSKDTTEAFKRASSQGIDPVQTATQILDHIQQKYTPQQEPQDPGVSGVAGVGLGATKGAFSTLNNLSNLGQSALSQTVGRVANLLTGKGFTPTEKSLINEKNLQANGTAENIGKVGEQIGEFFIPGGALSKVGKVADAGIEGLNLANKAGKAGEIAQSGLKLLSKIGLGAGEAGGITALQTGGDTQATKNAALFGGAVPIASKLLQPLATKFAPRLVNSLIKPLSKDFEFGKNPGQAIVNEGIKGTTWEGLISNIKNLKNSIGEQIGSVLKHPEVAKQQINLSKALAPLDEALANATRQGDQPLINKLLDFKNGLTKDYSLVNGQLVETGVKPNVLNPEQGLQIKKDIGDSVRWREGIDNEVNKVKVKVYQAVRNQLEEAVNKARQVDSSIPDISKLNNRYANLTTAETSANYRKNIVERTDLASMPGKLLGGALGGVKAYEDIKSGNYKNLPADVAIGLGGAALDKVLGSVGGKTYGAQVAKNVPNLLQKIRNVGLGLNSSKKR